MSEYIKPWEVRQGKFPVDRENVIYCDDLYSLALSVYDKRELKETNRYSLGMRWQTDRKGWPKLFGRPIWMIVPDPVAIPILKNLLEKNREQGNAIYASDERINDAIEKIKEALKAEGKAIQGPSISFGFNLCKTLYNFFNNFFTRSHTKNINK